MKNVIHHTFAPLADREQCLAAFKLLMMPWKWHETAEREELRKELATRFKGEVFLFSSGREALLAILRSLTLKKQEEVIVQGYTCIVVPNAITAAGLTPVYADIEPETLNLDIEAVKKLITPHTRAIICQHTFGIPADTETLRYFCDTNSIHLIEDCAHVMPDETGPKRIGAYGDFLFFSFGRDKAISGVAGGAVVCRQRDLCKLLHEEEKSAEDLSLFTQLRLLLYPLLYAAAKPLYGISIGKAFLALAGKLKLLVPIVSRSEKNGRMSPQLHAMPNTCATLALLQLRKLQQINDHRRSLTRLYLQAAKDRGLQVLDGITTDLPLQKLPLFTASASAIRAKLKAQNIHLDDGWTGCVICPPSVDPAVAQYAEGMDPKAEAVCPQILSLPTHPGMTEEDAKRLIDTLEPMLRKGNRNATLTSV